MVKRVGDILLENDWVDAATLQRALSKHRDAGKRLCSYLVDCGALDPDLASRALGELHGVAAVLRKHLDRRDPALASKLSATAAHELVALPIGRMGGGELIVCVRDPSALLHSKIQRASGERVMLAVCPASLLEELVTKTYGAPEEVEFDVDLSTGPIPSLDLDPIEDTDIDGDSLAGVTLAELVELDDHAVAKDASQSMQFNQPTQRSSGSIALPRTLTPPPSEAINPPSNRGASGLDVLNAGTVRGDAAPPPQRTTKPAPGRSALDAAVQAASAGHLEVTSVPHRPTPVPASDGPTGTDTATPRPRTGPVRTEVLVARTLSRSDVIPVRALDDPDEPPQRALAVGSVLPDRAKQRELEVQAVLSLELDGPTDDCAPATPIIDPGSMKLGVDDVEMTGPDTPPVSPSDIAPPTDLPKPLPARATTRAGSEPGVPSAVAPTVTVPPRDPNVPRTATPPKGIQPPRTSTGRVEAAPDRPPSGPVVVVPPRTPTKEAVAGPASRTPTKEGVPPGPAPRVPTKEGVPTGPTPRKTTPLGSRSSLVAAANDDSGMRVVDPPTVIPGQPEAAAPAATSEAPPGTVPVAISTAAAVPEEVRPSAPPAPRPKVDVPRALTPPVGRLPTLAGSSLATPPVGIPIVKPPTTTPADRPIPAARAALERASSTAGRHQTPAGGIPKIPTPGAKVPVAPKPKAAIENAAASTIPTHDIASASSRAQILDAAVAAARTRWATAILFEIADATAYGRRAFGPSLGDEDAEWLAYPTRDVGAIRDAIASSTPVAMVAKTDGSEAERELAKTLGGRGSAIRLDPQGSLVLLVGAAIAGGSDADLMTLGRAVAEVSRRLAAR